ncbi:M50 family metallopeptidase [Candidatus Woesearchaeota archaeon]|nr:M50 family metallopeptidase [Candidatus Woesearchaeota archaeon]
MYDTFKWNLLLLYYMVLGSILGLTRDSFGFGINPYIGQILDIVIIALVLGFIFKDYFRPVVKAAYDPLLHYKQVGRSKFWLALIAISPAVVLHEVGHYIIALVYGAQATIYASYGFLALGVVLKLAGAPFLFFVPGFVSHSALPGFPTAAVSFSGPAVNLVLFLGSWYLLKNYQKYKIPEKYLQVLGFSKSINLFLFAFNMIPIRPFDGGGVVMGLIRGFMGG